MTHVDLTPFESDIDVVKARTEERPSIAMVLGSGLDALAETLDSGTDIPYSDIRGMSSPSAVAGHSGTLTIGRYSDKTVLVFRGRVHRYQGVSAYQAAYPARLAAALGVGTFIATNAAGSVDPDFSAGDLMLLADHLNLIGDNPLVGWPGKPGGTPFVPMGEAYDAELRALALSCAADLGIGLREGVYAGLLGPSYETPAEVRYLRTIGANAVGMSTVPEVIAARALDMRVLAISLITNAAGGSSLSHEEVLAAGERSAENMVRLLSAILDRS